MIARTAPVGAAAPRRISPVLATLLVASLGLAGSLASGPVSAETTATPPSAPAVEAIAVDRLELSWAPFEGVEGLADYRVEVYPAEGTETIAEHLLTDIEDELLETVPDEERGELDAAAIAVRIGGLEADTEYRVGVVAVDAAQADLLAGELSDPVRTPATVIAEDDAVDDGSADDGSAEDAAEVVETPAETTEESTEESGSSALSLSTFEATALEEDAGLGAAPTVTVRGGTVIEVNYEAFAGESAETYPTIGIEVQTADGTVARTASGSPVATTTIITGLDTGTAYRVQLVESGYDENWNTVEVRRSALSAEFTTDAESVAPGTPEAPTIEAISGSELLVAWPAVEEGGQVRTYTVRLYNDDGSIHTTRAGINPFTAGTQASFTGLDAQTPFTATVQAIGYETGTEVVNGAESEHSESVSTLRGVPSQPAAPVLSKGADGTTDVVVSWEAPASDGGYDITGYEIQFYQGTGTTVSTAGFIGSARVDADTTTWTYEDATLVQVAWKARVLAINEAGASRESAFAQSGTTAATATVPATASPSTAVGVANNATSGLVFSDPTEDGVTVTWSAQSGANVPAAGTGYLVRVVEHQASNAASSTNYTATDVGENGIIDLGTDFATSGRLSATLEGLNGGRTYRVAITQYVEVDGVRQYRISSTVSAASVTLPGSSIPAQPIAVGTLTATGVDSLSWTGSPLAERYNGGSEITGYRAALYLPGGLEPIQVVEASLDADGNPTAEFTGLERDTAYRAAYAGVNEHGIGVYSSQTEVVRTLARPAPGSEPLAYADLAALNAAIAAGDVELVDPDDAGLSDTVEPNSVLAAALRLGVSGSGEVWLYSADGAAYQAELTIVDGEATASWSLGDLPDGQVTLVFTGDRYDGAPVTPVATRITVSAAGGGPAEVDNAVFRWGINTESSNGAFYGGCNYFVAGKAPDAGGSQLFTSARYSAQEGNVTVVKPDSSGEYQTATWQNKCLTRNGTTVTSSVTTPSTEQQIVITGGEGTVDPATHSGEIQWDGDFTVVYYGGLTFWYASDPKLTVVDGVGTVTATLSGYGANMFDATVWQELEAREVTLAVLDGVRMTSTGFTVTPEYVGVELGDIDSGAFQPQTPRTSQNASYWGTFPRDFIEFQVETGQVAYWYASGGAQDRAKPTLPLTVVYDASQDDTGAAPAPDGDPDAGVAPPTVFRPPSNTGTTTIVEVQQAAPVQSTIGGAVSVTSVTDLESLRALIASGQIVEIAAEQAGIPGTVARGERLDVVLDWPGEDTSGTIWIYPDMIQAGTFRVVDGVVTVSLDTSVIETQGENYLVFFGDAGTTVAVPFTVEGEVEAVAFAAEEESAGSGDSAVTAVPISLPADDATLLWLLLAGGLALAVLAAAGGGIVLLRSRRPAAA